MDLNSNTSEVTIWVDIEDLLAHFYTTSRPTGIQRLTFELYRELWRQGGEAGFVRFSRHRADRSGLEEISWPDVERRVKAAFLSDSELNHDTPLDRSVHGPTSNDAALSRLSGLRRWAQGLPHDIQRPLATFLHLELTAARSIGAAFTVQRRAARAAVDVLRGLRRRAGLGGSGAFGVARSPSRLPANAAWVAGMQVDPQPGDIVLALGASWQTGYYPSMIAAMKQSFGIRFAFMIYDLIPLLYPEFVSISLREAFGSWLWPMLGIADTVFTISGATLADIVAATIRHGHTVPIPTVVPIGVKFPDRDIRPTPLPNPYVLIVSTIEIRKNHSLLFRIWRRMLAEQALEQVPDLVFAGKIGWQTADLMEQIRNTNYLQGKLRIIEAPSDRDLASLYQNCLFTVFPSLYEGWGLPVTESLSFGKTVAASKRASIPEAGGEFCDYFDPDDLNDAYRVILRLIADPAHRQALEQRIAERFYPPCWGDSAAAVIEACHRAAFLDDSRSVNDSRAAVAVSLKD